MTGAGMRGARGFSLSEMLVVVAIVGLAVAIAIPLTSEQVRLAKVRSAADEFAIHLKAARMIAVTKRQDVVFTILPDPVNAYTYRAFRYPVYPKQTTRTHFHAFCSSL